MEKNYYYNLPVGKIVDFHEKIIALYKDVIENDEDISKNNAIDFVFYKEILVLKMGQEYLEIVKVLSNDPTGDPQILLDYTELAENTFNLILCSLNKHIVKNAFLALGELTRNYNLSHCYNEKANIMCNLIAIDDILKNYEDFEDEKIKKNEIEKAIDICNYLENVIKDSKNKTIEKSVNNPQLTYEHFKIIIAENKEKLTTIYHELCDSLNENSNQ